MSLPLLSPRITTAKLICAFGLTTRLFFSLSFLLISPSLCQPSLISILPSYLPLICQSMESILSRVSLLFSNWKFANWGNTKRDSQSRYPYMRFLILSPMFSSHECVLHPYRRKLFAYPEADLEWARAGSLIASSISMRCVFPYTFERKQWFHQWRRDIAVSLPSFRAYTWRIFDASGLKESRGTPAKRGEKIDK